jgi:hypothetical protein
LPTTKDKNAAKVRLLNALNSFKLEVPAWISKVESDLKKEWETENRKLKKSGKSDKDTKGATRPSRKTTTHQDMNITGQCDIMV